MQKKNDSKLMIVFGSFLHFLFYRFKIGLIKGNLNIVKFKNLFSFIRKNVLKTIQYDKQHYQRLQTIYSTDDDIIECLSIFKRCLHRLFLIWFGSTVHQVYLKGMVIYFSIISQLLE